MAAASAGAVRKRPKTGPLSEGDFPPLDNETKSKKAKNVFVFGRGDELEAPKFMVIEREEEGQAMKSISVFKVKRELKSSAGIVKRIQPLQEGKILLVEVYNAEQAEKLLKVKKLGNKPVKVSWHATMNKSKGVVACFDWTYLEEEELKNELKAFNVSDVRRVKKKLKEGELVDTGTFILTFDSPSVPESLDAFYYPLKVRIYIPNPPRCYKCHRYGHMTDKCRLAKKICGKCLLDEHEGSCKSPALCANCGDEHFSWNRSCPIFKKEYSIMRIKVTEKISYYAAKQKYEQGRSVDQSFAEVVAKNRAKKKFKEIAQKTSTHFHPPQQEIYADNRNGVAYPEPEFLAELRKERIAAENFEEASPARTQVLSSGVSDGDTKVGALPSTGKSPNSTDINLSKIGQIIHETMDIISDD